MRRRGGVPLPKGQRKDVLVRLLKTVFSFYPVMLPITLVFILFNAIISSIPSVFMQNIIALWNRAGVPATGPLLRDKSAGW